MCSSTLASTSPLDGGWVVNATLRPLYLRERPGTHCIGGWVGPRASLDGYGKSFPHRDSIPGASSPWQVAIQTELFRPLCVSFVPSLKSNSCTVLNTQNSTDNKPISSHAQNRTAFQPSVLLVIMRRFRVINKGRAAYRSAKYCQGQMQTPQSLSVPIYMYPTRRRRTRKTARNVNAD